MLGSSAQMDPHPALSLKGRGRRERALLLVLFLWPAAVSCANSPADPSTLIITHGGTYRGSWESHDRGTPAITIKTTEPVTIEDSTVRGPGVLIASAVDHSQITVRRTRGYGENPGVRGKCPGRFIDIENCASATIENNYLEHTAGIYFNRYAGDFGDGHTITILRNIAKDIDGRYSDGHGGWLDFNTRTPLAGGPSENGYYEVQFAQLDHVQHLPGIEIAWNQVINDPGDSRVEDNINIYLSSGTPASPIQIHDNYIDGAYTIRPAQGDTADANYQYDWSYAGGGIMLADGSAIAPADATAFVDAFDNIVLDTSNYAIAISAGHDCRFHDNLILSAATLTDGNPIAAQTNSGAYIWDAHHDAKRTTPTFYNNSGDNNLIGWTIVKPPDRADWWVPSATGWQNNRHWQNAVTLKDYQKEWTAWQQKQANAHIHLGP
jgi:hypothetical protein